MYVARILYPVEVLGIGKRIGIWFCGCPHHCSGCSNPELWEFDDKYSISLENLLLLIKSISETNIVDGFTITGGDPFFQSQALSELIDSISGISDDILVYTGYTLSELHDMNSKFVEKSLENIAVLIDGRYIAERNNGCSLRGSDNQQIHFLNSNYKEKYDDYLKQPNSIQNFTIGNGVVSVGIHNSDYFERSDTELRNKGLVKEHKV